MDKEDKDVDGIEDVTEGIQMKSHSTPDVGDAVGDIGSRSIALIDKNINILWDSCDDFATEIEQKHKDFFNNSYKMDKPDISSAYNGSAPKMIKIFIERCQESF